MTAEPARIRRCNRDLEYASVRDDDVLAARPDARPVGRDSFVLDSFMDERADAQVFLEEKFVIISRTRRTEKAEAASLLGIGTTVPVAPELPLAQMIDRSRDLDAAFLTKGLSIDFNSERNSVEAIG